MADYDPAQAHPEHAEYLPEWTKLRDVLAGERGVKGQRRKTYLPPLSQHEALSWESSGSSTTTIQYEEYLTRSMFLSATGRTRDSLVGALLRRQYELDVPETMAQALEVTGVDLQTFDELLGELIDEVVGVGRVGVLVDATEGDYSRPYAAMYKAEDVLNWDQDVVFGIRTLTSVTLREMSIKTEEGDLQVRRRLMLDFEGEEPTYRVEIHQETEPGSGKYTVVEDYTPQGAGGAVLNYIPFTFIGSQTLSPSVDRPPLTDLASVNLSHYRNSADLEHGLHFTALPQPWVAGFEFAEGEIPLGSGNIWVSTNPQAGAGYLEFTGQGLGAIRETMAEKTEMMAALGARFLMPEAASETATAARLRASGATSALSRMGHSISRGVEAVLYNLSLFVVPGGYDVVFNLNSDFDPAGLDSQQLRELFNGVQTGMLSWNVLAHQLRTGEIYPDGWSDEDEADAIRAGAPGQ